MLTSLLIFVAFLTAMSSWMMWRALSWIEENTKHHGKAIVRIEATTNGLRQQGDINTVVIAKTLTLSEETAAAQKLLLIVIDKYNALSEQQFDKSNETLTLLRGLLAQQKGQA